MSDVIVIESGNSECACDAILDRNRKFRYLGTRPDERIGCSSLQWFVYYSGSGGSLYTLSNNVGRIRRVSSKQRKGNDNESNIFTSNFVVRSVLAVSFKPFEGSSSLPVSKLQDM